jgi:hypothetical protein
MIPFVIYRVTLMPVCLPLVIYRVTLMPVCLLLFGAM